MASCSGGSEVVAVVVVVVVVRPSICCLSSLSVVSVLSISLSVCLIIGYNNIYLYIYLISF